MTTNLITFVNTDDYVRNSTQYACINIVILNLYSYFLFKPLLNVFFKNYVMKN